MFTRAIVRPPAPNFSEGLTTAGLGEPDYELALRQHEAYCAALEQCGLTVTRLEADARYPDSCFVEDTAIVLHRMGSRLIINAKDAKADAKVAMQTFTPLRSSAKNSTSSALNQMGSRSVLTRPGAGSRQGEVASTREALNTIFPAEAIHEIRAPGTLDGGDICEAGNHFLIGLSERTNEAGAQQLAEILATSGYTSSVVGIRNVDGILHLKSGVAYLVDNRLVVTEAMAQRKEFASYDLLQVPYGEEYSANCVRVNDHVLIAAGYPGTEIRLRELGYRTISLEMSEFQKMDGGLSCLSLRF